MEALQVRKKRNFVCNEKKLDYEYLYYVLKHEAGNIEALAGGMTYPEINKSLISKYKIPLPLLEEQQKIVFEIQKAEDNIKIIQEQMDKIRIEKAKVLQKYL